MQGYVLRERLQDILISKTSQSYYIGVWSEQTLNCYHDTESWEVEVTIILWIQKGKY